MRFTIKTEKGTIIEMESNTEITVMIGDKRYIISITEEE